MLIKALLARAPEMKYSYPPNPRAKKKEEQKALQYLFVSTKVVDVKDKDGVMHQRIIPFTYRRPIAKQPSKRDTHRSNVKEK